MFDISYCLTSIPYDLTFPTNNADKDLFLQEVFYAHCRLAIEPEIILHEGHSQTLCLSDKFYLDACKLILDLPENCIPDTICLWQHGLLYAIIYSDNLNTSPRHTNSVRASIS